MRTIITGQQELGRVVEEFNVRSWIKQGTWPGSLLWFAAILESFSEEWTGRVLDPRLAIDDYACIGQPHGAYDCLIGADCFKELRQVMEQQYAERGPEYFRDYAQLCELKCQEWLRFARSVTERESDLGQLSNEDLAALLRQYFTHLRENGAFMDTIIVLADLLGDVVGQAVDALLREYGVNDPSAYGLFLETHMLAPLPTNISLSESSLRDLAGCISDSVELRELFLDGTPRDIATALDAKQEPVLTAIREHVKRFGWLNTYSFLGQPFSIEEVIGFLQEKLDALDEIQEEGESPTIIKKDEALATHLRQIEVPAELRELLDVTHALTYVNTAKDDVHQITWQDAQPLMKNIAGRLGCQIADLTFLTPSELEDAVRQNCLPLDQITERSESWALIKLSEVMHLVQGRHDMEALRGSIKSTLPMDIEILTGRAIYPGKVRGQVKLVLTVQDCDKVRDGDILVATNTNPDFIPAMRRASAFITDTGNLICHAVIAAREFKKPCVIATSIATQVLTDGEWVEMDGSTGTVVRFAPPKS